jgi:hypothetical protein
MDNISAPLNPPPMAVLRSISQYINKSLEEKTNASEKERTSQL